MPAGGPEPVSYKVSEIININKSIAVCVTPFVPAAFVGFAQPRKREYFKLFHVYNSVSVPVVRVGNIVTGYLVRADINVTVAIPVIAVNINFAGIISFPITCVFTRRIER